MTCAGSSNLGWSWERRNFYMRWWWQLAGTVSIDLWCMCRWVTRCHQCPYRLSHAGSWTSSSIYRSFFLIFSSVFQPRLLTIRVTHPEFHSEKFSWTNQAACLWTFSSLLISSGSALVGSQAGDAYSSVSLISEVYAPSYFCISVHHTWLCLKKFCLV